MNPFSNILYLIGCIPWPSIPRKRGRPYVYSPTVILRCFIVKVMVPTGFQRCIVYFLIMDYRYNHKLVLVCGLLSIPCRRTFDMRLNTISTDLKERISTMGYLFVTEGMVMVDNEHSIATAIDST